jgi:hypothetical protein
MTTPIQMKQTKLSEVLHVAITLNLIVASSIPKLILIDMINIIQGTKTMIESMRSYVQIVQQRRNSNASNNDDIVDDANNNNNNSEEHGVVDHQQQQQQKQDVELTSVVDINDYALDEYEFTWNDEEDGYTAPDELMTPMFRNGEFTPSGYFTEDEDLFREAADIDPILTCLNNLQI